MKTLPIITLIVISAAALSAQPADNVAAPERLRLILDEIKDAASSAIVIKLQESTMTRNAEAYREGSNNYIRYNPAFVRDFERNAQTKWAVYSLLSHELGHLILGHDLNERNAGTRQELELNADNFAGRILNTLGATREEALAGFRNMNQDLSGGIYPAAIDREYEVSDGWDAQEDYWKSKGQHPRDAALRFEPRLGGVISSNWAKNAQAVIKGSRMEINYKVAPNKKIPSYRPFLLVDPHSSLVPETLDWVGDSTQPGNRTVIWYFERDGYKREQVVRPDELGIGSFAPKYVPRKPKGWVMPLQIAGFVGGLAAAGIGYSQEKDAYSTYKNTYLAQANPNASVYEGTTRTAVYNTANDKHKKAQYLLWSGIGVATGSLVTYLVSTLPKAKRAKKVLLYPKP